MTMDLRCRHFVLVVALVPALVHGNQAGGATSGTSTASRCTGSSCGSARPTANPNPTSSSSSSSAPTSSSGTGTGLSVDSSPEDVVSTVGSRPETLRGLDTRTLAKFASDFENYQGYDGPEGVAARSIFDELARRDRLQRLRGNPSTSPSPNSGSQTSTSPAAAPQRVAQAPQQKQQKQQQAPQQQQVQQQQVQQQEVAQDPAPTGDGGGGGGASTGRSGESAMKVEAPKVDAMALKDTPKIGDVLKSITPPELPPITGLGARESVSTGPRPAPIVTTHTNALNILGGLGGGAPRVRSGQSPVTASIAATSPSATAPRTRLSRTGAVRQRLLTGVTARAGRLPAGRAPNSALSMAGGSSAGRRMVSRQDVPAKRIPPRPSVVLAFQPPAEEEEDRESLEAMPQGHRGE